MRVDPGLLRRLQRSWWFAWIAAIVLGLGQLKDAVEVVDKVWGVITDRPDAITLAKDVEKSEFSRGLTEAAWKRMFWARAFLTRIERKAPQTDIDEAWKAHIAATEVWSTRIMVYIVTTEKFYGRKKSDELEFDIQEAFGRMSRDLAAIRYAKDVPTATLANAEATIDELNKKLYIFVRGMAPDLSKRR